MSTYQSVASYGIQEGTHVIIPKPSGLAVGDLMLAGIFHSRPSGVTTITTPSGWTLEQSDIYDKTRISVFSKIAESADVSASDFTFNVSDQFLPSGGIMLRISNVGIVNAGETSANESRSTGPMTITGFTPSRANCLLVFFGCRSRFATDGSNDVTSASLATSNPTWTNRSTISFKITNDSHVMGCFTATRPESTATGNISFNFVDTGASFSTVGIMLAIAPVVSGSYAAVENKLNAYAFAPIQSAKANAVADDPTAVATNPTVWTPITKA